MVCEAWTYVVNNVSTAVGDAVRCADGLGSTGSLPGRHWPAESARGPTEAPNIAARVQRTWIEGRQIRAVGWRNSSRFHRTAHGVGDGLGKREAAWA